VHFEFLLRIEPFSILISFNPFSRLLTIIDPDMRKSVTPCLYCLKNVEIYDLDTTCLCRNLLISNELSYGMVANIEIS